MQQLQTLHDRLLHSRDVQAGAIRETSEPTGMDIGDKASDDLDHDVALSILSSEQDALYELDAALSRIADGRYGICEETGEPIPEERLRVLPWTRYTLKAAERLEQHHMESSPVPDTAAIGRNSSACRCLSNGTCARSGTACAHHPSSV
jgi:DnaK suppressor protein